jgi:hypothetical protein
MGGAHATWYPIMFQGERETEDRRGNDIRLCLLATLGYLQVKCLLLQYRRVAIHEVSERPELVLVQQRNGELGLQ